MGDRPEVPEAMLDRIRAVTDTLPECHAARVPRCVEVAGLSRP